MQARSHHDRACIASWGGGGGMSCFHIPIDFSMFSTLDRSIASTWGLLNFAIPVKTCTFTPEFRRHSGGVWKDFIKPKSVIRLFCANETFFLSSVSSLLGYNGTPLRPQSGKTSVQK